MRDGQFSMYSALIVQLGPITLSLATAHHSLIFQSCHIPPSIPRDLDINDY